ncbi:MAG: ATPase, T2SS/T4P/T4SS family [Acidobacteriota bacterium]|nr:ATPase, T2SS/T4P/T4SS family [Acidobacteriota bacterium]
MSHASGIEHLRPFLPGLESVLADPSVSEVMINGPHVVWVERQGRLSACPAPDLDAEALMRAAIQICRPLALDPARTPTIDARLADGSRVAVCVPPASPQVTITVRRFGNRSFSAEDLVEMGSLPPELLEEIRKTLRSRHNILVSGGTGSGKTTLLNALIALLPQGERIVTIEDTLELRVDHPNAVRFEAGGEDSPVTIRGLVKHALRHRPDHIVVGEVRGAEGADLLQALNTGHGGSLTTVHANNSEGALQRLANCAMMAEGGLPWEAVCRSVVDGISMVVHMTRREGRRFVEDAIWVNGYSLEKKRFEWKLIEFELVAGRNRSNGNR